MEKVSRVDELAKALAKAKEAAMKYIDSEDGGTCNLDSCAVRLAGWRESMVKKACEIAGVSGYKWENDYLNWHICFTAGQGNRRSRMAEAFTASLSESGYEALDWSSID